MDCRWGDSYCRIEFSHLILSTVIQTGVNITGHEQRRKLFYEQIKFLSRMLQLRSKNNQITNYMILHIPLHSMNRSDQGFVSSINVRSIRTDPLRQYA